MSTRSAETAHPYFANDSWQTPKNARTLRAFMALRQAEIGERLVHLRRQRGNPPQEVVAQAIGVSYRALQAWEAGDTKPSWRNLTKLAEYYGVSEEFILIGEVDPTAPRNLTQLDRVEEKIGRVEEKLDLLLSLFRPDEETAEEARAALRRLREHAAGEPATETPELPARTQRRRDAPGS